MILLLVVVVKHRNQGPLPSGRFFLLSHSNLLSSSLLLTSSHLCSGISYWMGITRYKLPKTRDTRYHLILFITIDMKKYS